MHKKQVRFFAGSVFLYLLQNNEIISRPHTANCSSDMLVCPMCVYLYICIYIINTLILIYYIFIEQLNGGSHPGLTLYLTLILVVSSQ
jgi:hypothetical protein